MNSSESEQLSSDSLQRLVENHRRFLAFLRPRVRQPEDAEEILQNAFAKAAAKEETLRDDERVIAWFYRMLRNALIDYYRKLGAEHRSQETLRLMTIEEGGADGELERTICACVGDLIPTLKPEYAHMVQRVDLDGASVLAAAHELGISPNNASVRLHRARQALRERLVQSCGTCTEHGCLDCSCKSC